MNDTKVVCLVSGGIDSPVACALMAKKFKCVPLHFCLYPFTCEETFLLAMKVLRDLRGVIGFEKVIVYPWGEILGTILKNRKKRDYACVACRKSMFRVAEMICEEEGAAGIVTGESLGQKATQTLANLRATSTGIKFPVLRPLLGLDKNEIVKISKGLGIWHERHAGCCFATPKYPNTKADPQVLDKLMGDLQIHELIKRNFEIILEVRTFKEDFEEYLFTLA